MMRAEDLITIKDAILQRSGSARRTPDRDAQRLLLHMFAGTRGGVTRLRIICMLSEKPMNTNQIATATGLDYKAVQHHLAALERNSLVTRFGQRYGAMFCMSGYLEANMLALEAVFQKLQTRRRKAVYL